MRVHQHLQSGAAGLGSGSGAIMLARWQVTIPLLIRQLDRRPQGLGLLMCGMRHWQYMRWDLILYFMTITYLLLVLFVNVNARVFFCWTLP